MSKQLAFCPWEGALNCWHFWGTLVKCCWALWAFLPACLRGACWAPGILASVGFLLPRWGKAVGCKTYGDRRCFLPFGRCLVAASFLYKPMIGETWTFLASIPSRSSWDEWLSPLWASGFQYINSLSLSLCVAFFINISSLFKRVFLTSWSSGLCFGFFSFFNLSYTLNRGTVQTRHSS